MSATRTPTGMDASHPPPQRRRRQWPPAHGPAEPDTQILNLRPDDEFLARFGDTIDDRIAETLDELLEERNATRPNARLLQVLGTVGLILTLAASVLLRHSALAVWMIWPPSAAVCLAIAWTARTGKQ